MLVRDFRDNASLNELGRDFYRVGGVKLGPLLLGKILCHNDKAIVVTEVEAYMGQDDEASHAFRGISLRNKSMFLDGGTIYVYLSYGLHKCVNVVAGRIDQASAVLIRSGIPISDRMTGVKHLNHKNVLIGPGRIGKYLGADLSDDGEDLLNSITWKLFVADGLFQIENSMVLVQKRVGISKAIDLDWRFSIKPEHINGALNLFLNQAEWIQGS